MNHKTQNNKIYYLYRIINKINGKIYIGQTIQPNKRWSQHRRDAMNPTMTIHYAINKYGAYNFEFEVIAGCKTWENANEIEALLISQYNSVVPMGYNVSLGGMNAPKSEIWIQKIKKHWTDPEFKEKMSNIRVAIWQNYTPEQKDNRLILFKMSGAQDKGIHNSPTTEFKKGHIPWSKGKSINKGRAPWNKGTKGIMKTNKTSFKSKFTFEQVNQIIKEYLTDNFTQKELSVKYGVGIVTISKILNNKYKAAE